MGLFDKLMGSKEILLSPMEALALAGLTMIGANAMMIGTSYVGDVDSEKVRRIISSPVAKMIGKDIPITDIGPNTGITKLMLIIRGDVNALEQALNIYQDKEVSECVQLVNSKLNDYQKLFTLVNLLDLATSSGVFEGAKKKLMLSYINTFGITEYSEFLNAASGIMVLKNNFSPFFERV